MIHRLGIKSGILKLPLHIKGAYYKQVTGEIGNSGVA